jgi:hypothetical protein
MDAGLVEMENFGINSDMGYKSRRRATCSPLRMTYGRYTELDADSLSWSYNYEALSEIQPGCLGRSQNCTCPM